MLNEYDLSIVIPTRNRIETASIVINGLLKLSTKVDLQIVVTDNSDTDDLKNHIDIDSEKLIYTYIDDNINFSENFKRGLELCSGRYLCYIGDDDYVSNNIDKAITFMDENKIESLSIHPKVSYFWDKVGRNANTLQMSDSKWKLEKIDVIKAKKELLNNGGMGYLELGLPKIYHGIIKKDVIDRIRMANLEVFDSLSPDIFSSYVLSQFIQINYVTNYPFTIPGSSQKSASGSSINNGHIGTLDKAPHFRGWNNYNWHENIPKFYSVQTIWAESLEYAIEKSQSKDKINYESLYKVCYDLHSEFKEEILKVSKYDEIPCRWRIEKIKHKINNNAKRILFRIKIILNIADYICVRDVNDITIVNDILEDKCERYKDISLYV